MDISPIIVFLVVNLLPSGINTCTINNIENKQFVQTLKRNSQNEWELWAGSEKQGIFQVAKDKVRAVGESEPFEMKQVFQLKDFDWQKSKTLYLQPENKNQKPKPINIQRANKIIILKESSQEYSFFREMQIKF